MALVRAGVLAALGALAGPAAAADPPRSGFDDMSAATQAMQRDDRANPAWLWLLEGQRRFAADCARCHAGGALDGAAARYPVFDAATQRPLTLAARIARCQREHVGGPPLPPESEARLALEMAVAHRARGRPIAPPADPRLAPWRERGERLFRQRIGQLDLACAHCHDDAAGRRLAGAVIPQGHPSGYPIYRLEWQGVGSLQRRLRACMSGVRAQPFDFDSDELAALELYLMTRAAGLPIETPAVRP